VVQVNFQAQEFVTIGQHEIASVSPQTVPKMFQKGSSVNQMQDIQYLYTAADWSQINLYDNMNSPNG